LKNLAIIPARGGSKRIPGKNVKDFLGKPVIAYSIEAALKSELFDKVMVSTDDENIADISRKFGAIIPFYRSIKNSDDFAITIDVLSEVINEYKKLKKTFDFICCIYPTAPFITSKKLINSYKYLQEKNADSLIPVVKFSFPIQRALKIENEMLKMLNSQYENSRSQDLETFYHDTGQFYWIKSHSLIDNKSLLTKKTLPFELLIMKKIGKLQK
jgi:N-acylneuraminate cytidylyltransferase